MVDERLEADDLVRLALRHRVEDVADVVTEGLRAGGPHARVKGEWSEGFCTPPALAWA